MRIVCLVVLFLIVQACPVWAGQKYDIEILPARTYAKAYHLTCSKELSPCSIAVNFGNMLEPEIIEVEALISEKSIHFEFSQKRRALVTAPRNGTSFSLRLDDSEPRIFDLYKPYVSDSSMHAVVRPAAKFLTSLQISFSEKP